MSRAEFIRKKVFEHLPAARMSAEIPALKGGKQGKVRHVYTLSGRQGDCVVVISASDRISVFDQIQDRAIPFKGAVLNAISRWAFEHTRDIVPNAWLGSPTAHIMIQRKLATLGIECVIRGYMWGSLASEYERGVRLKCGLPLKDGLWRYQKLEVPIFTPTTKADSGHDEDIAGDDMATLVEKKLAAEGLTVTGQQLAAQVEETSRRLYERGAELAVRASLIMVDTKYEFGLDPGGKLHVIDEMHTPDSSRYVDLADWEEHWARISDLMNTGRWQNVNHLLAERPELKIPELSKQLVRDLLLERGYDPISGRGPSLQDEDVVETAARYIELYERLTGEEFDFQVDRLDDIETDDILKLYLPPHISES